MWEEVTTVADEEKNSGLEDLIEALTILSKYDGDRSHSPTNCENDVLRVWVARGKEVSPEDAEHLENLGFHWDSNDLECWYSYRFGSC